MKPESTASRQMVGFSLGKETTMAEIDDAVAVVSATVSRLSRS
jgi:cysteine sulfinate desulfinase/cysteine desulfurase-like protein